MKKIAKNHIYLLKTRLVVARFLVCKKVKKMRSFKSGTYGGSGNIGKAKVARPIEPKMSLHLIFKVAPEYHNKSLLKRYNEVIGIVFLTANLNGVKVYHHANVSNHLHLLVLPGDRKNFIKFAQQMASQVAVDITGAKKGKPLKVPFFSSVYFSRIVNWGGDFRAVVNYIARNSRSIFSRASTYSRGYVFGFTKGYAYFVQKCEGK